MKYGYAAITALLLGILSGPILAQGDNTSFNWKFEEASKPWRRNSTAQGANVAQGLEAISNFQPELVFLDVEMTDGTGVDLLEKLAPYAF